MDTNQHNPMFRIQHIYGKSRTGLMNGTLPTPNFLLYTKRATPCALTQTDILPQLQDVKAIQISLPDLLSKPGLTYWRNYNRTCHEYLKLEPYYLFMNVIDNLITNSGPCNEKHCSLWSIQGKAKVTASEFVQAQDILQPNAYACLSDESNVSLTYSRAQKGIERSLSLLEQCIAERQLLNKSSIVSETGSATKKRKHDEVEAPYTRAALFAVVQGDVHSRLRQMCAEKMYNHDAHIDGYVVGGFHLHTRPQLDLIQDVLNALPSTVPATTSTSTSVKSCKPVVLSGFGFPNDIVMGVSLGIDLFTGLFPHIMTKLGWAFTFDYKNYRSGVNADTSSYTDLHDTSYKVSSEPLASQCPCYACTTHTRAYIHHLLQTHEMLGEKLLQIHNTYQWTQFFASIRSSIKDKTFDELKAYVEKQWSVEMETKIYSLISSKLLESYSTPLGNLKVKSGKKQNFERKTDYDIPNKLQEED